MPDFITQVMYCCESINGPKTANIGGYEQTNLFCERVEPDCTCPAYKFGPRDEFGKIPCRHIEKAQSEVCGWAQLIGPEKKRGDADICPRCGGPVALVKVAV